MIDWIDRYTYEVARRLPEEERDDVKHELTANIYDMLPDNPTVDEIKQVLNELGSPAEMAEKYRQTPRYLIGPALYDSYIRAIKWIVPLVGFILLSIGIVLGVIEGLESEDLSAASIATAVFTSGISLGLSGAFQALFWTTLGFVIAEHTGSTTNLNAKWTVKDLKDVIPDDKRKISLSDSIVELVLIVVFSIIFLLICLEILPIGFAVKIGDFEVRHLFSDSFMVALIPAIIIGAILGIIECITKIAVRRWTPLVCAAVIIDAVVGIALSFYLLTRSSILNPEFVSFIEAQGWIKPGFENLLGGFPENPIVIGLLALITIASLASIGMALYRTFKVTQSGER